jgi:hypothetical protein
MSKTNCITQEKLKEVLEYNNELGTFTWKVSKANKIKVGSVAGCKNNLGYILIRIDGKIYLAHRLAWLYTHGSFPLNCIDHINQIKDDNRICNLRDVTVSENMQNQAKVLGYTKNGSKYKATIRINNILHQLGSYITEEQARQAYLNAKKILHTVGI